MCKLILNLIYVTYLIDKNKIHDTSYEKDRAFTIIIIGITMNVTKV